MQHWSKICRTGRRVISDSGTDGTRAVTRRIASLRLPLTPLEVQRIRRLSRVVVHAVEVTAGHLRPGMTEADVAGEVSHRLLKRTVTPVRIQVCADGRNERYRHWSFGEDPIESFATITCVARRWGLHAGVSRTVALGQIPDRLQRSHELAALAYSAGIWFSRPGSTLRDIWTRVRRIYEKFGLANEWQLADQADVLGYRSSEIQLTPDADFELQAPVAIFWHPSAGPAMLGDSVLVQEQGCERLTHSDLWPPLIVRVKGHDVMCPGILRVTQMATEATGEASSVSEPGLAIAGLGPGDDEGSDRIDSVWELKCPKDDGPLEEDGGSAYSEQSVLD